MGKGKKREEKKGGEQRKKYSSIKSIEIKDNKSKKGNSFGSLYKGHGRRKLALFACLLLLSLQNPFPQWH